MDESNDKRRRGAPASVRRKAAASADRAKVPLLAGGAALAGIAGGVLVGARHARRDRGQKAIRELGKLGAQLGHLASELQQAREGASGDSRRSPIEVVLEGLTARRSPA